MSSHILKYMFLFIITGDWLRGTQEAKKIVQWSYAKGDGKTSADGCSVLSHLSFFFAFINLANNTF